MKKYRTIAKLTAVFVALAIVFSVTYTLSDEYHYINDSEVKLFTDVSGDSWYYEAVSTLGEGGIIPGEALFRGDASASRYDIVLYLYNLSNKMGIEALPSSEIPFTDVNQEMASYVPVSWAYANSIASGYPDNTFLPGAECSKEQLCAMIVRFMDYAGIKAPVKGDTSAFADSLTVSQFARSNVVALKLAGIINGNEEGNLNPLAAVSRGELAVMVNFLYGIFQNQAESGVEFVNTSPGAYDYCYDEYKRLAIEAYIPYVDESEPVDLSYFDDAVFIGDSVSMSLQYYCAATGALGNARFLCAGSLSPANAHWPVSDKSVHPVYQGQKLTVEDGVALTGARKVYIMLGINSLYPFDECVVHMKNLVYKILEKSPDAKIILQTVTPMTQNSPIKDGALNNLIINKYNKELYQMAKENGWYYLNVAEALDDENGNLKAEYCSDPNIMGIHFNYTADKVWVDYLLTHAPKIQ